MFKVPSRHLPGVTEEKPESGWSVAGIEQTTSRIVRQRFNTELSWLGFYVQSFYHRRHLFLVRIAMKCYITLIDCLFLMKSSLPTNT